MKKNKKLKLFTTTIIGGQYRGRKIEIPAIHTTRGSKSILKESLFNTLQFDLIDKNFVELFSGSGSIGLEALSRGAGACYFIEYNPDAYRILEENAKKLDPSRCHLFYGDSFEKFPLVQEILKRSSQKSYFYFDPPFSTRDGMDEIYDKTIAMIESIDPDICEMAIVEHMTKLDLPPNIGTLTFVKRKKFGRSSLSYYRPKEEV
ncbi:MAG TPA: 16S rRNA (guanine(966)-N(2))-methyltransferase RsmD [Epsilonproteobacteria bacterium]|nr:16S rRNA (guanine(966)-N(2))-methyltransferase RsmD [Campylobacterota bacterium]